VSPKRTPLDYLQDILVAMEDICSFVVDMDYEVFAQDKRTNYAVVRALEVIGEATKHVPKEVRQRFADVPWRDMAGMRDKLIHSYFGVDLERVWETATQDVPVLIPLVREVLDDLEYNSE
jgi:uncharacterized protein with HEPN domain